MYFDIVGRIKAQQFPSFFNKREFNGEYSAGRRFKGWNKMRWDLVIHDSMRRERGFII
jgi:hypothetical protein